MTALTIDIRGRDGFSRVAAQVEEAANRLQAALARSKRLTALEKSAQGLAPLAEVLERASGNLARFTEVAESLKNVGRRFTASAKGLSALGEAARGSLEDFRALEAEASKLGASFKVLADAATTIRAARRGAPAQEEASSGRATGLLGEIQAAAQGTLPALKAASEGLGDLGERLDEATDPINKLRNGIEGVGDRLVLLGRVGEQARNVIEEITDPVYRLRIAAQLSERALRGQGLGFTYLSDRAKAARAELILFFGSEEALNRTVAQARGLLLGLAGAGFGAVTAAVTTFVTRNKEASKALKGVVEAGEQFLYTLGSAIVGGRDAAASFGLMEAAIKSLTVSVDDNREAINSGFGDLVKLASYAGQAGVTAVYGLKLAFDFLSEGAEIALYKTTETILKIVLAAAEAKTQLIAQLPLKVREATGLSVGQSAEQAKVARGALEGFYGVFGREAPGFKRTEASIEQMERVTGLFGKIREGVDNLRKSPVEAAGKVPGKAAGVVAADLGEDPDERETFDTFGERERGLLESSRRLVEEESKKVRGAFERAFAVEDLRAQGPEALQGRLREVSREAAILTAQMDAVRRVAGEGVPEFEALRKELDQARQTYATLAAALGDQSPWAQFTDGFSRAVADALRNADQQMRDFGREVSDGLQQSFTTVFASIGEGFGQALAGGDGGVEIARQAAGQIASIWGDLMLARAAAEFWINPLASAGLALAGGALKGLASQWGAAGGGGAGGGAARSGGGSVAASAQRFADPPSGNTQQGPQEVNLWLDDNTRLRGYLSGAARDDRRRGR